MADTLGVCNLSTQVLWVPGEPGHARCRSLRDVSLTGLLVHVVLCIGARRPASSARLLAAAGSYGMWALTGPP